MWVVRIYSRIQSPRVIHEGKYLWQAWLHRFFRHDLNPFAQDVNEFWSIEHDEVTP